jgi:hypothetical protein
MHPLVAADHECYPKATPYIKSVDSGHRVLVSSIMLGFNSEWICDVCETKNMYNSMQCVSCYPAQSPVRSSSMRDPPRLSSASSMCDHNVFTSAAWCDADDEWHCPKCTFVNANVMDRCKLCNTKHNSGDANALLVTDLVMRKQVDTFWTWFIDKSFKAALHVGSGSRHSDLFDGDFGQARYWKTLCSDNKSPFFAVWLDRAVLNLILKSDAIFPIFFEFLSRCSAVYLYIPFTEWLEASHCHTIVSMRTSAQEKTTFDDHDPNNFVRYLFIQAMHSHKTLRFTVDAESRLTTPCLNGPAVCTASSLGREAWAKIRIGRR